MSRLDEFLPEYDARERHERRVPGTPELAVAAALGTPVAPDGLVRTLFRVRGLPGGGSVLGALRAIGLEPLVEEPTCVVLGAAGRPWSPRSRLTPFDKAGAGQVRIVFDITAQPATLAAQSACSPRLSTSRTTWTSRPPVDVSLRTSRTVSAAG